MSPELVRRISRFLYDLTEKLSESPAQAQKTFNEGHVREIRLQLAKSLHLRKLGIQLKVRVCELGQHLGKFFCRGLFILILNERELEREY